MNFDLGPYSGFIWPAYAISALALLGATVARARLVQGQGAAGGVGAHMKRWSLSLPVLAFAAVAFFLYRSLYLTPAEQALPSPLLDKPVPQRTLPALRCQNQASAPRSCQRPGGDRQCISSTCVPCRLEAPMLSRIAAMPGMVLYGFVWKDSRRMRASFWMSGQSLHAIGQDTDGHIGLEWGVYGWPEPMWWMGAALSASNISAP